MKGGNCLFYYLCSKIIYMTFEEAISLVERIRNQVVGAPVKGRFGKTGSYCPLKSKLKNPPSAN